MAVKTFEIVGALLLGAIPSITQTINLSDGEVINFTGEWPAIKQQGLVPVVKQILPAMKSISEEISQQWEIHYSPSASASTSCGNNLTYFDAMINQNGQVDTGIARELLKHETALAMFIPCGIMAATNYSEAIATAKGALVSRTINKADKTFLPETFLGIAQAYRSWRYGARAYMYIPPAPAAWFEVFAAKMGGSFTPLDQAWNAAWPTAWADMNGPEGSVNPVTFLPKYNEAIDRVLGRVTNRLPSTLLQQSLFEGLDRFLGEYGSPFPTDGNWLHAYALGQAPEWDSSNGGIMLNPFWMSTYVLQRKDGVTSSLYGAYTQWQISDASGAQVFATQTSPSPSFNGMGGGSLVTDSDGLQIKPADVLTDGAYRVDVCALADGICDQTFNTVNSHFVIDNTGWASNKLVVITNGPESYGELKASVTLAPDQPYTLTSRPGAIAIGGLPDHYAEVALTDGTVIRTFPWVPDAGTQIWTWTPLDDPLVFAAVDAATFKYSGTLVPGSWTTLFGAGFTQGDPDFVPFGSDGRFPAVACKNEYGETEVIFTTLDGQQWPAAFNYCSFGQINVQVPPRLADYVGQSVTVQVKLNNTLSNPRQFQLVAVGPYIFQGAITNALTGQAVSATNPVHAGDYISVYYTGCDPLEAIDAGKPAPLDHLVHTKTTATATIDGILAQVSFDGLAPGLVGVCQLNALVPKVQGITASVQITIGDIASNLMALYISP